MRGWLFHGLMYLCYISSILVFVFSVMSRDDHLCAWMALLLYSVFVVIFLLFSSGLGFSFLSALMLLYCPCVYCVSVRCLLRFSSPRGSEKECVCLACETRREAMNLYGNDPDQSQSRGVLEYVYRRVSTIRHGRDRSGAVNIQQQSLF